jgi:hypothetical protein
MARRKTSSSLLLLDSKQVASPVLSLELTEEPISFLPPEMNGTLYLVLRIYFHVHVARV